MVSILSDYLTPERGAIKNNEDNSVDDADKENQNKNESNLNKSNESLDSDLETTEFDLETTEKNQNNKKELYKKIKKMKEEGKDIVEIADKIDMGIREVELFWKVNSRG